VFAFLFSGSVWARPSGVAVKPGMVIWCLLAGVLAAGCTAPKATQTQPQTQVAQVSIAPPARPDFQEMLSITGIDLQVPQRGKAILVNIPSFELIAFEDGEPVLRSRVIVGRPAAGDMTPEMDTITSVVRFRPSWRPTPMMIRSGKYEDKIVRPGPRNPLGLLAIRLEPGMLIYLHGTNRPELFDREDRALSAGCVRVERWDELAAWVLGDTVDAVHGWANGRRTFDMETSGIPVLMRYFTVFPDADGNLQRYVDVYGLQPEPIVEAQSAIY
jgi:hypothetical protein